MVKRIIQEIIDNFQQQLILYHSMAELSAAQLECLGKQKGMSAELQEILIKRQALMETISSLNEKNRVCQQQAVKDLQIEEFVLRQLHLCMGEESYSLLQNVVMELGKVLESINETDRKNQLLMTDLHSGKTKDTGISHKQAGDAYKKSMQSGNGCS